MHRITATLAGLAARSRCPAARRNRPPASRNRCCHHTRRRPTRTRSSDSTRCSRAIFEDALKLSPLLGDVHRRPSLRRPAAELDRSRAPRRGARDERKYLDAIRAIDPAGLAPADRISYDIFLRERERELRAERFPVRTAAAQPGRQPADRDARARLGHQRAAVPDRGGLRQLAEAPRRAGRLDGPGDRQHARRRREGRRAAARGHGEGAAAARRDGRRTRAGQPVLRTGQAVSGTVRASRPRPAHGGVHAGARHEAAARLSPPARLRARRIPAEDALDRRLDRTARRRGLVRVTTCRSTRRRR